jgi:multidrug efflux pump
MLARFFIDRPIFAWVIALVILFAGVLALRQLPVASYPPVAPPALSISVSYPGASAKVVEESAIAILEQELNGLDRLLYFDSTSEQGTGSITLTFESGTNLDLASVETQNRLKRVETRLPEDVRRLGVPVTKSARNYLLFVSMFSPDGKLDNVALGAFATANVLESIRRVPGVGEAILFGTDYAMRIWLQPDKLRAFGLSSGDIAAALRAQNIQLATGQLGQLPAAPGQELTAPIVLQTRLSTPEEFGAILVRTLPGGASVYLRDIAHVELGAQSYDVAARIDGKPAASVAVRLAPDANALDTARAVRARMHELEKFFPKEVDWVIPYDTSTFVDISIREVVHTLAEAMVLVFLVMYLFMGNLRATFIPTIVVPVALVGAMVGLYFAGYSINVLTLFAMVLAIGIVVDDAIVVVENVERIMTEEGLGARAATRKAMDQIVGAIIAITLVLSAVFVPMAFFPGAVGAIYRQFAVTLVLTMGFSALMALTLTPALCATLLDHHGSGVLPTRGLLGAFNRFFAATTQRYRNRVATMLGRPGRWLVIYLLLVGVTGYLFTKLPGSFLPEEDQGYFISVIQLPPGATRERTLEVLSAVEQHYLALPEVKYVTGVAGFSFFGRGQNGAITFVRLKPWDEREAPENSAMALIQRINKTFFSIKQAMIFAVNPPPIPELAALGGFDLRLQDRGGIGREKLLEARAMALGLAAKHPLLAGVRPEGQEAAPHLQLNVDRLKARALGVDLANLNETLQTALGSNYVNDFVRDGRILRVVMSADETLRRTPEAVLSLPVRNQRGDMIALGEFARAEWTSQAPKLDRFNGLAAVKLSGGPAPGRSTGEAMAAMEEIVAQLPAGVGFDWAGSSYEERRSGAQAPLLFAVSIIVVFLCLAALYESWSIPVAVMMVVPLGMFGAVSAVLMRGMSNDVYFKVGLIAIIGLAAKNAILIIEFAKDLQAQGRSVVDAVLEACRLRFRPILMTSIAFICGVLPLAISTGAGANSRHAIGTGVMGGMIAATVLAVFFVPVFFVLIRRWFPLKPHKEDHD